MGKRPKPRATTISGKAKASRKIIAAEKRKAALAGKSVVTCPVFEISQGEFPGHAQLVLTAEKMGIKLTGLTRLTGKSNIRRNRRRSQALIRKAKGGPRKGHDYDEFPYASTHQGGTGAHVEENLSTDNQGAGRALGAFYRKNNINEGDTYDVTVTK